jgi:hypothetical protein
MHPTLRLIIASVVVVFASLPRSTLAEVATTQIMLTDKHIEAFILVSVAADKTIPASQKKELLKELNATLKSVEPIQFSSNVDLVKKYYDAIDVTMIGAYEGENHTASSTVRTIGE